MNARCGLKRIGLREWLVEGPHGTYVIERDSPRRWYVRAAHIPKQFYNDKFRRLRDARVVAEGFAGVPLPYFLDRRAT